MDIAPENNVVEKEHVGGCEKRLDERTFCRFRKLLLQPGTDYEVKYREAKAVLQNHSKAGKWLLSRNSFVTWKGRNSGLFWLTGVPGAGKTVLSSVVVDDLKNDPNVIVLFSYCDHRDTKTRYPTNIYANLLYQLLSANFATGDALTLARILGPYRNVLSRDEIPLGDLILNISREVERKIVVLIDGLENCHDIQHMVLDLAFIAQHLPVFVASRDHPDIRDEFGRYDNVTIDQDDIIDDLRRFVRKEAKHIKVGDPGLQAFIVDKLLLGAQGNFSWTASHIRQLHGLDAENDIRKSLIKPPRQISKICTKGLKAIDALPHSELLRGVIRLVVCAVQPITLRALTQATTTFQMGGAWYSHNGSANPRWLVDDCANLLKCVPATHRSRHERYWAANRVGNQTIETNIDDYDEIVIPFHPSVRDFLTAGSIMLPRSLLKYALHPLPDVHATLARLCQSHLDLALRLQQQTPDHNISRNAFTNYALSACPLHFLAGGRKALDSRELFTIWSRDHIDFWEPIMKYYLGNFDIDNINARGLQGGTALHWAVRGGSPDLVTLLLEKGAKVDLVDDRGDTPLLIAVKMAKGFSVSIINQLLGYGADINARDRRGYSADYLGTRRVHGSLLNLQTETIS
ncbi:hypothetical protein M378DRAFT_953813 [Amanita muscaria Koide BX008]|uniref:Nephrocystin 3-like N-terminal domain-containing protein n=1 Tax=Amanita muscaria (strain Koide BX008) TaxID=946122 RepID=A0A0C2WFI1_AMAMK|nr:hypothetical protein M378DRAFT_953813 [Amanita muscaria Koide BX008]